MPLPWLQIVQLVPSILDVSRELMRRTRGLPAAAPANAELIEDHSLSARVATLEDNERRQAELVNQMAEQINVLTQATTALHSRVVWLTWGCVVAVATAVIAVIMAV